MAVSSLRRTERKILLVVVDLILINMATVFALWFQTRGIIPLSFSFILENSIWFISLSGLWLLSASLNGLYSFKKITVLIEAIPALLGTVILIFVVYFTIFFYSAPTNILPRGIVVYQSVSSLLMISIWRVIYSALAQLPGSGRRVIIVGAGWAGKTIAKAIHNYAQHEYSIAGFVDDDESKSDFPVIVELDESLTIEDTSRADKSVTSIHIPILGSSSDLTQLILDRRISEVIVAVTQDTSRPLFQALLDSKEQGVQISLMPVLYEQLTGRVPIEHIGGDNWYVALPLDSVESGGFYPLANRIFDILGALVGLGLLLPFFPILSFVMYMDSPGPIFYKQERLGKGGKPFNLYKLRTMIPNAEKNGAERAKTDDDRITRIGKILRKMRLDEMPQLINVLKGEMSAVGPRPERPEHLAELDKLIPFHRLRNSVKPGMAGWAVVNYGYIESIEDAKVRLQYDLYYVKHQSLWLDTIILLRTIWQALTLKGR